MGENGTRESFRSAISAIRDGSKLSSRSGLGYAPGGRKTINEVTDKQVRDGKKETKDNLRKSGWSTLPEFARIYAGETGKTDAAVRGHITRLSLNIVREKQELDREYSNTHTKKIGEHLWCSPQHLAVLRERLDIYFS